MSAISAESRATEFSDSERIQRAVRDNAWLHFTQMADYQDPERRPLMLVRGEGTTVWDIDGNAYLDLLAGIYSVNAGYGRQRIVDAMAAQAALMPFVNPFGSISVPAAVLADRLGDLAPLGGDARVFFTSGGSEAVESALKLAKQYHTINGFPHRYKTVSRRVAYHGTTMGALSVNGLSEARVPFGPLVPGARHAPMSHRYRCPYCREASACTLMCYDEIERIVEFEGPDQVAAIILEPVQNAGGCIPPGSPDYFKTIRKLCDDTGIPMIMDEVIRGVRPARRPVRLRVLRRDSGSHHDRERDHVILCPAGRCAGAQGDCRCIRRATGSRRAGPGRGRPRVRVPAWADLWRPPGFLRGGDRQSGHHARGGSPRPGERDG